MRRSVIALGLLIGIATGARAQNACGRVCLEGMLDRYVDALVARNPSTLPLASAAKFTENGRRLELGDGLWHTVTGRGNYALRLADVERGQAVLMGTVREADTPTILVERLKVSGRRIGEVETLVIRNEAAATSLDTIGRPRDAWAQAVSVGERHTRADLVRIANMYFSGIERKNERGSIRSPTAVPASRTAPGRRVIQRGRAASSSSSRASSFTSPGPVESVLHQVPYGMGSGWSSWAQTMSSEPRDR